MSMLNEKRAEELLALTTKMIQAPSYSGQENLVVDVMKKFCDEHKIYRYPCGQIRQLYLPYKGLQTRSEDSL